MRVMISCGEPSGDLYAGALAEQIRKLDPSVSMTGFGGERLRAAGVALAGDFSGLSVTGLMEVVRVLPRTYAAYRRLIADAAARRPDVFVAVDFPDFNFRLAGALRRMGVPVVYYISPQLWAWRPRRMKTMRRIADRVLVIFPFEESIYRDAGVRVQWVGHPLLDVAVTPEARHVFLQRHGVDPARPVVALLPGSRRNEVRAILPGLRDAAQLIRAHVADVQFILARAPHLPDALFEPLRSLMPSAALPLTVLESAADNILAAADVALVASGTVTVQSALHECPMVVVYRLSPITYRLGRPFVQIDTFAMVNLVAGRKIMPELIQNDFTPQNVAAEALRFLQEPDISRRAKHDLRQVRAQLGEPGASRRAAEAVLEVAAGRGRRFL